MPRKQPENHGMTGTREYVAWQSMLNRCYKPNTTGYERYGGRGITVCDRWRNSFVAFMLDVGIRPSPSHSLDRIESDGNYEPGNCRWATKKTQVENRRVTKWHDFRGQKMTIREISRTVNMPFQTLYSRIHRDGWTLDEAVKFPPTHDGKSYRQSQAN